MLPLVSLTHELMLALSYTAAFGLMFLISELIYAKWRVDAELTRKFIHLSCGIIAITVPIVQPHVYTIIILGIAFSLLTYYMLRNGLLPSVHAVKRHTIGSVLYPLGIVICVIFGMKDDYGIYFYLPMCNLVFSDTVAAIVGINFPLKKFSVGGFGKSIGGSIGFFSTAFFGCYFLSAYFTPEASISSLLAKSLIFASVTMAIEMLSVDGWDDLSVPASSFLVLFFMNGI